MVTLRFAHATVRNPRRPVRRYGAWGATERKQRRVHVLTPEDLVSAIDALVGSRCRSRCIVETVEGERRRRRQRAAIAEMDGALERRAEDVSC
jgi:hypothetical protein